MDENTTKRVEEICKKAIPFKSCKIDEANNVLRRVWLKKEIVNLLTDGIKHLPGVAEDANKRAY